MKCTAITLKGTPCSRNARNGHLTCGIHAQPETCDKCKSAVCAEAKQRGIRKCRKHLTSLYETNYRRIRRGMERDLRTMHVADDVPDAWFETMDDYSILMTETHRDKLFEMVTVWMQAHPNPPVNDLAAFVADGQNVHTEVVSKQTNTSTDLLLAMELPAEFSPMQELLAGLLKFGAVDVDLLADIIKWYNTESCRNPADWLYRRMLNALLYRIRSKDELFKRFLEEARDSVGMCCEGHISRLCNVLVGFDDAFKPPVPVGELLQQRMSAIALKDISEEDKVQLAREVLSELRVPQEQHAAWIEAF